jgi:hypothetical protein
MYALPYAISASLVTVSVTQHAEIARRTEGRAR